MAKDVMDQFDTLPTPDVTQMELPSAPKDVPGSQFGEAERKQRSLGALVDAAGWSTFVENVRANALKVKTLDGIDISKLTEEEIGRKFVIGRLAAAAIEEEINKVIAIADAIKRHTPDEEE